jgi:hypothetical protein
MIQTQATQLEPQYISYQNFQGDIPIDLENDTFISVTRNQPFKIYSLGFQPAKSIPEIPRWFLQKYAQNSMTILDPFAGSGTTIIESLKHDCSVYWLDYHPLSRLICQVKTSDFVVAEVREEAARMMREAIAEKFAPNTVNFSNKDFWFQPSVQAGLEIIKSLISKSNVKNQPLFWLAFASTVRKTSNMNDGMLLAARRTHIAEIPQRSREDVFRYFQFYLDKAIDAVVEWQPIFKAAKGSAKELPLHDARNLTGDFRAGAIVTSPPYINAIDYVWAAKFELHWLGLVKNNTDRLDLYAREIGTERIPKKQCQELGQTGHPDLDRLIEDIYTGKKYQASQGQNQLRARVVYQYFMDMIQHFKSSFLRLNPGGYYCFSMGDVSKICGVEIPVASLLTDLANQVGFQEKFKFHLILKNRQLNLPRNLAWAGSIKHDTIVVLEKPNR